MKHLIKYFCYCFFLFPVSLIAQENDTTDVLADILKVQEEMPEPTTNFRPGHVSPREIQDYLTKTDNGFIIQLPKAGMTPSPTIYKNMLFVGGGFGSKEFYAFDAKTGKNIWGLNLDDDGPSSAVVVNDRVVFNTESCTIFACNAHTGELDWSYFLGDPMMSTPTIADGLVFTAYPASRGLISLPSQSYGNYPQQQTPQQSNQNTTYAEKEAQQDEQNGKIWGTHILIAMKLSDGEIVWQKWIDGDVMSAPVVEGKELYLTTFPGTFYKINLHTGEILAANAQRATSAPVVVGEEVYMSQRSEEDGEAVAEAISVLNRSMPQQQRRYAKRAAPYLDSRVQSASSFKSLASDYDAGNGFSSGAPANSGWQAASANIGQSNVCSLQAFQGSRVLHLDGKNYNTMGDELVCSDPKNGKVLWKHQISGDLVNDGGFLATPPINVADKIIIATLNGDIIIYGKEDGKEIQRYSTKEKIRYQPVVSEGWIYVTTLSGKVVAINTEDSELTGWPVWGANPAHSNRVEMNKN